MTFRILVTLLVLLAFVSNTAANNPCQSTSTSACEIEQGVPAPYSGTLMTKVEVWGLIDKVLDAEDAVVVAESATAQARLDADMNFKRYLAAKDTPTVFESPWFWLGMIVAAGLGAGATVLARD